MTVSKPICSGIRENPPCSFANEKLHEGGAGGLRDLGGLEHLGGAWPSQTAHIQKTFSPFRSENSPLLATGSKSGHGFHPPNGHCRLGLTDSAAGDRAGYRTLVRRSCACRGEAARPAHLRQAS